MTDKKAQTKLSTSETIDKDQDDLMSTLESIRGLLEQNESKLTAARESITNANNLNDTSTLSKMRSSEEEIVPILDQIIEPGTSLNNDSQIDIPELDSIASTEEPQEQADLNVKLSSSKPVRSEKTKDHLASLTQKNLLLDALDNFQIDLEQSLREDLMKTMIVLEKDLKEKISKKINQIKDDILK